jgi:HD-GYP domain-containing protein (c-di-GMP phosphodiesterase class II)
MFDNLGDILDNSHIPNEVRSQVFLDMSKNEVDKIFQDNSLLLDAATLENLYHIVQSSVDFLSFDDSLRNIGKLVSHDYMTYSHCVHVFVYVTAMMQRLQFDLKMITDTGVGSLLHDIGKSLIPRSVLNKPEKLNAKEWDLIKCHPVYGLRLSAGMNLSSSVLNCIIFHHEHYDGTGYPSGLYGQNIPYPVRILTCCDVYDALISNRPYAKAEKPYQALAIMNHEMQGTFDPDVLKHFILMLGNF